ncbi:hypothetical protein HPB52_006637 [Rhipicephalus sanguineus]|uniref:Uncharacterized protein n=1 Tax=Rhipicephalus sanguineus TaxID=34632 RepID=A0A9D4QDR9_RHISA|nr:hypothetical protein HPB52_006637 [Rhipicephalus sanguineus]
MEIMEMTNTAKDPTRDANSPEVTELDMPVDGTTQDIGRATTGENPKRGACSPKSTTLTDENTPSWLRCNKLY